MVSEKDHDLCLLRITARARSVEGLSPDLQGQAVKQQTDDYSERYLLAYAFSYLREQGGDGRQRRGRETGGVEHPRHRRMRRPHDASHQTLIRRKDAAAVLLTKKSPKRISRAVEILSFAGGTGDTRTTKMVFA